jgi:23S rRNA pseudouridine2605 synthase/16S rRNA pseudouridine516 synthase
VRRGTAARTKDQRTVKPQRGPKAFKDERFGQDLGAVPHHKRRRRGPSKPVTATPRVENPDGERLQKVMAHAGVASRRECEDMITTGRVEVNGHVVRELGLRVKPDVDTVHVDGVRLQLNEDLVYFAFNKPAGVVSSMHDDEGRRDISDFLREGQSERLYHVGRLDFETEGLLLLTNDGELAHRLTHPSFEIPKTYLVQVRGPMPRGVGKQLREGVHLEDGWSSVDSFRLVDSTPGKVLVEVVLHSGKNRIVRRMFDAVGFPVLRLVRMQIGPIRLGDQHQGSLRKLGKQEVGHLLAEVGL